MELVDKTHMITMITQENRLTMRINIRSEQTKDKRMEATIMESTTFSIPNISCGHCLMTIKNELSELDGVKTVDGNPENKEVTVKWEPPATLDKIKETLQEINYPAQ